MFSRQQSSTAPSGDHPPLTTLSSPSSLLPNYHKTYCCHENSSPAIYTPYRTSNVATSYGKPRSRFSDIEDAIICEGVARGLTWGQISAQLPHRKRATCFNRYRTLQGIRKSRKREPPKSSNNKNVAISAEEAFIVTPPSSRRASLASCSTKTSFTQSPSPPPQFKIWSPSSTPSLMLVPEGDLSWRHYHPMPQHHHHRSAFFGDLCGRNQGETYRQEITTHQEHMARSHSYLSSTTSSHPYLLADQYV